MKERRNRSLPLRFKAKRYSRARDFLQLAVFFSILSFVFYRFVYLPVFSHEKTFKGKIRCEYYLESASSSEPKESHVFVETDGESFLVKKDFGSRVVREGLFGEDFFAFKGGDAWLYERSLNPYYIPFSQSFGRFLLQNEFNFKDFINHGEIIYLNRKSLRFTFSDWLVPDKRYEIIIDKETYFPLFLKIADSSKTILRAKAVNFDLIKEGKLIFRKPKKFVDVYAQKRLEPAEVSAIADFDVKVPSYVPLKLKSIKILYLREYTPPLSPLKFSGKLIMFNYFGNGEFANILEYRGSFPLVAKNGTSELKVDKEKYRILIYPGYHIAWKTKEGITIVVISNLARNEIVKIIRGLAE